MSNTAYLVAAYVFLWAMLFGYLYSIARKQHALERDIQALRRAVEREQAEE